MLDHFSIIAPIYDRLIPSWSRRRLIGLLDLPVAGRMLDAGGGTGRVARWFTGSAATVVVGDTSHAMLAQTRSKNGLCPVRVSAEKLPFAANAFERILVVDALHHFNDQALAIAELIRVLKPQGRMVIEEPDPARWPGRLIAIGEAVLRMGSRFYTAPQIVAMVEACGASARVVYDRWMMFWVVVQKPADSQ
jgi:demethylmenaquinone methyltransferase/2-methoxy-6-polyprenyl-1,4-benzoquinol methylase